MAIALVSGEIVRCRIICATPCRAMSVSTAVSYDAASVDAVFHNAGAVAHKASRTATRTRNYITIVD